MEICRSRYITTNYCAPEKYGRGGVITRHVDSVIIMFVYLYTLAHHLTYLTPQRSRLKDIGRQTMMTTAVEVVHIGGLGGTELVESRTVIASV